MLSDCAVVKLWLYGLILVWLGVLSVIDLRERAIPHWGSTVPLIAMGLFRVVYPPAPAGKAAWLAGSAILLLLVVVVTSDEIPVFLSFSVTALVLGLQTGTLAVPLLIGFWVLALLWANWGIWGSGDAKVAMILVAIWPDITLVAALLLAQLVGGVIVSWRRHGQALPAVILNVLGEFRKGNVPARQSPAQAASWTYNAGVPWLTLGTAMYMVRDLWLIL